MDGDEAARSANRHGEFVNYRIIRNRRGYIPQRYGALLGWDSIGSGGGVFFNVAKSYATVEEARSAIDAEEARRAESNDWHTGAFVEYYDPNVT